MLLIVVSIVIIIRCKTAFKQRSQDPGLPQRSTYVKSSSLSLDDNSRFVVNLRSADDPRSPLDTRVEVCGAGPQVSLSQSHCSSISQLANSPIYSPSHSSPCSPNPRAPPTQFSTFLPHTRTSPEGSEGADQLNLTHSASNICHQTMEDLTQDTKKCSPSSSADRDEGIESEDDIDATAFKQLILSNVGEESVSKQFLQFPLDKEDLYAKINYEAKRYTRKNVRINSVESPSNSLCSDGNSPTLSPPSSLTHPTPTRALPNTPWNKSTEGSESECLI